MTPLTIRLRELTAFDLSFANFRSETFANNNAAENIKPGHITLGQEIENIRLRPIFDMLIECVCALEEIAEDKEESSHERAENAMWAASSQIKKLRELMEGK